MLHHRLASGRTNNGQSGSLPRGPKYGAAGGEGSGVGGGDSGVRSGVRKDPAMVLASEFADMVGLAPVPALVVAAAVAVAGEAEAWTIRACALAGTESVGEVCSFVMLDVLLLPLVVL